MNVFNSFSACVECYPASSGLMHIAARQVRGSCAAHWTRVFKTYGSYYTMPYAKYIKADIF